jgi:16S rRNA (uracil1498-N3)-methyltransferase
MKESMIFPISLPKKDAFEEILKISVECGVNEIHPLSSKYSQYQFIESERSNKLIESALIQSNNFYWPSIKPQINLDSFLNSTKSEIFYFTSKPVSIDKKIFSPSLLNSIILIGPEGGFSNEEDEIISNHKNSIPLHLSTPILRAPTATAAAFGYLLALKNMRL